MLRCASFQGVIALTFDESPSLGAPAAFGTYRVLHQTGSGVLGPVFRACAPRRDDLVAIKALKLDILPDQIVRVTDALRRLAASPRPHAGVVDLLDAGLEGTSPFLVMTYLAAETLDVVIRREAPMRPDAALGVLRAIAHVLDDAAAAGLAHGALHPRDVFASGDLSTVSITGMGVIQALEASAITPPVRRSYASPERVRAGWDSRADIYSLAAMAHELLTRRHPAGPGEQHGFFAPSVSARERGVLRQVLGRALAEQPGARFGTAMAFVDALAGAVVATSSVTSFDVPGLMREPASGELIETRSPEPDAHALPFPVANRPAYEPDPDAPLLPGKRVGEVDADERVEDAHTVSAGGFHVEVGPKWESSPADWRGADDLPLSPVDHLAATIDSVRSASRRTSWLMSAGIALLAIAVGVVGTYLVVRPALGRIAETTDAQTVSRDVPDSSFGRAFTPVEERMETPASAQGSAPPPAWLDESHEAALSLESLPAPSSSGRITVRSEPSGAMVTMRGRLMGDTPLTLRGLALGTHSVQVARPGHVPRVERVTLSSASPTRTVTVALVPAIMQSAPALGAIDVESRPRGARVTIDGRFVGHAPLRLPELRPGTHLVTLDLGGYQPESRPALVAAGRVSRLTLDLMPQWSPAVAR